MTLSYRFSLFLLLLSFLQPWRLVASTPGADGFLKHVFEEGELLVKEVTGEEGVINELSLNAAQVAPNVAEERALIETFPMDADSIAEPTSSLPELEELVLQEKQRVAFLDDISMAQVSLTETAGQIIPQVFNLGDHILRLPPAFIFQFFSQLLRSPEAKQAAYKVEHQQAVQALQLKYPELAQQIDVWKNSIEEWSECRILQKKEALYQNITALVSSMPSELYSLIALSQAMQIIEDAIPYTYYLTTAWDKYDQNTRTEEERKAAARAKIILLTQINITCLCS